MALRTLGLVIAVAAIVGVGWWLVNAEDDVTTDGPGRSGDSAAGLSARMGGTDHEPTGVETDDLESREIDTERFAERERKAVPDALTFVFEDEGHHPQAGVDVTIGVVSGQAVMWVGAVGAEQEPHPVWGTFKTDSHGEVVLRQLPPAGLEVVGRNKTLLGFKRMGVQQVAPGKRVIVTMKPIRHVEVKVVDQAGQPVAGAPVGMQQGYGSMGPGVHWTTRPDGTVRFEVTAMHTQAYGQKECTVNVRLPLGNTSGKAPWVEGDVTRVDVKVKSGTLVRVKVIDADGNPSHARRTISWNYDTGNDSNGYSGDLMVLRSGWEMNGLAQHDAHRRRTFEGSETLIAGFQPGKKLTFKLEQEGRCPVEEKLELPSAGSLTELVIREGAPAPVIEIPFVHGTESGPPVVAGRFKIEHGAASDKPKNDNRLHGLSFNGYNSFVIGGANANERVTRSPDRGGVIRVEVQPGKALDVKISRDRQGGEMFVFWGGGGSEDDSAVLLKTRVAALEPGEVRRIAAVVVPELPVIVAGRVTDPAGNGVKGALVRLAPPPDMHDFSGPRYHLMNLKVRTDEDGHFLIAGDGDVEGWRAYARMGETGRSAIEPFRPGQDDLVLAMVPAGSFEGRLISSLPGKRPYVRFKPEAASVHNNLRWVYPELDLNKNVSKDGTFEFEGLAPGRYTAVVRLADYEVLVVPGVVVRSGVINTDPRLDGVTVGSELIEARVTVRGPDGSPIAKARVQTKNPAGESGPRINKRTDDSGVVSFIVRAGARRNVTVTMKNYLNWSRNDCTFPLNVTLDPGTRVVVELDVAGGGLPVDERIRYWQVTLKPKSKSTSRPSRGAASAREFELRMAERMMLKDMSRSRGGRQPTARLNKENRATFTAMPAGEWTVSLRPVLHRTLKRGGEKIRIRAKTKAHELGNATTTSGEWDRNFRFTVRSEDLEQLIEGQ